ncbi:major facilitator superfamily domain-containing protein [Neohortaea acidophila]|uniref:Major facilitator superfamily domain-containing protein n=1 Tax=Neohortaea acidophila TaxID=245834 RepID=A0A6A6Q134_9PEZI|nr:major facilitator superfamily domain-containing protein [Neohortaea acidophila]KAF2485699.1 major facilitator superfamily domain-containing protein [Neohortaea acidophila]
MTTANKTNSTPLGVEEILPQIPDCDVELADIGRVTKKDSNDPYLVAFAEPFDAECPRTWSNGKKWTVTDVLSATGFNRIMLSTIMAPALPVIAKELHMSSTESVMALSAYMLATAFGPLVFGPLSEIYGRAPTLHVSNIWFLIWNLVCGFANTKGLLIASRLLAGLGASAVYSLAGGVLGDIWTPEQRGKTLGVYLLIPLLGCAVGPIIGGFMAGTSTWRWIFWSTSAFQAVMTVASFLAFHETYAPVILRRKAARIRRETGDERYRTAEERLIGKRSLTQVLSKGLSRPIRLLAFNHIIQITALVSAVEYGLLYIVLTTLSILYQDLYRESVDISGLHYLAPCLGELVGSQIGGPLMSTIFKRLKRRENGAMRPEFHIPILLPGAIIAASGFLLYGWAAHFRTYWLVVDLGVFLAAFGGQVSGMPEQAYVIDSFPEYTSSATAASQFVRSLTAFGFPLFAPTFYAALGYGWGNTLLGFLALAIFVPTPIVIWMYGPKLRANARGIF